ncbi:hypothetical protein Y1Q_0003215 [Alligator mississippiensis]|uniref:Uncharacterized protein n=1 Tax=Alligator mississippiensis TaxID=8496 RepID=A0A151MDV9_ALLMI|nr:hypothetical protein Y1Q_0003215 [Alligator mississippiensis]
MQDQGQNPEDNFLCYAGIPCGRLEEDGTLFLSASAWLQQLPSPCMHGNSSKNSEEEILPELLRGPIVLSDNLVHVHRGKRDGQSRIERRFISILNMSKSTQEIHPSQSFNE